MAYKDLKIWKEALPLSFLQQSGTKELDGYYYPALVYYQPARYHQDITPFSRVYKSSMQTIQALSTVIDSVTEEDPYYCKDSEEVFDGHSCYVYRYLHMSSEFYKLELPIITTANQPQWTIEFWILLPWKQAAGDILTVLFNDGNKYKYKELSSGFLEYTYPSGTTSIVFTSALSTLDYTKSLWKPFRLTYTSAS